MAIACPVGLDTRRLREEIQSIYARVAEDPSGDFHLHRGPSYAAELLRYDDAALTRLPAESTASFAGVANPHRMGPFGEGVMVQKLRLGLVSLSPHDSSDTMITAFRSAFGPAYRDLEVGRPIVVTGDATPRTD